MDDLTARPEDAVSCKVSVCLLLVIGRRGGGGEANCALQHNSQRILLNGRFDCLYIACWLCL